VDVRPGEIEHVSLKNRGVGRVEGTISEFGTKKPIAGMRCVGNPAVGDVMPMGPVDESRQALTDAAGHFSLESPTGRVRVFCFNPNGGALSPAGTDVEVTPGTVPRVELVAVRATFGESPPNIGFDLDPQRLPIAVNMVAAAGPAAGVGVAPGDHVVTIDGQTLHGLLPGGAMFLLLNHRPGSTITLGLERSGAMRTAKITVR
jgi:hypothetical protein